MACITKPANPVDHEVTENENQGKPTPFNDTSTDNSQNSSITVNAKIEKQDEQTENNSAHEPEISTELYDKTFKEIDLLIKTLNVIIQKRDYREWLKYLTREYIDEKNDVNYLREVSHSPALKSKNIILFDIKDYFFYVIVPSNTNALLEKISFIDNNHVKAYGTIFKRSGILYYFEKIDEQWKIGVLN